MLPSAPFDRFLKCSALRCLPPHPSANVFYGPVVLAALARSSYCAFRFMHPDDLVLTLHSLARLGVKPPSNVSKPLTLAIVAALPDLSASQIVHLADAQQNLGFGTPVNLLRMHLLKTFMRRPLDSQSCLPTVGKYLEILLQQTERTSGRSSSPGCGLHIYAILTWTPQMGASTCNGQGSNAFGPSPPPLDFVTSANNLLLVLKQLWDVYVQTAMLVLQPAHTSSLELVLPEWLVQQLIVGLPWCTPLALSVLASMPRATQWIPAQLIASFGRAVQRAIDATPPSVLRTPLGVLLCHIGLLFQTGHVSPAKDISPSPHRAACSLVLPKEGATMAIQSVATLHYGMALEVVQHHAQRGETMPLLRLMHTKGIPSAMYFQRSHLMACIPSNGGAVTEAFTLGDVAVDVLNYCRCTLESFIDAHRSSTLPVRNANCSHDAIAPLPQMLPRERGIASAWADVVQLVYVLRARYVNARTAISVHPTTMSAILQAARRILVTASQPSSRQHCGQHVLVARQQLTELLTALGTALSCTLAAKSSVALLLLEYTQHPASLVGTHARQTLRASLAFDPNSDTSIVIELVGCACARRPSDGGSKDELLSLYYPLAEFASIRGFGATVVAAFNQLSIPEALLVVESFGVVSTTEPSILLRLIQVAAIYFNVHMRGAEYLGDNASGRSAVFSDWNRKGDGLLANYAGDSGVSELPILSADITHFMDELSIRRCAGAMHRLSALLAKQSTQSSQLNAYVFASREWKALRNKVQYHIGVVIGNGLEECTDHPREEQHSHSRSSLLVLSNTASVDMLVAAPPPPSSCQYVPPPPPPLQLAVTHSDAQTVLNEHFLTVG